MTLEEGRESTLQLPSFLENDHFYSSLLAFDDLPRLNRAREFLLEDLDSRDFSRVLGFGEQLYSYWRNFAEFIVLKKNWIGRGWKEPEYCAVKCSKRGNDVYERRIKTRLGWLNREIPDTRFFGLEDFTPEHEVHSSLLWVTLTCDPKKRGLREAWEKLGEDFNRFMSSVKRKYGSLSHFRVWESYESGYPHIHVVIMFDESEFKVFPHFSEEKGITFRIDEVDELRSFWHSHIDVQAISSVKNLFTYIQKHQKKIILGLSGDLQEGESLGFNLKEVKGLRTLFLCWLFRKRSFAVSGSFREKLSDLISNLHNSNMEMQVDLCGDPVKEWSWEFVGVFSGLFLGIPAFIWSEKLSSEVVSRVVTRLDERDEWKRARALIRFRDGFD